MLFLAAMLALALLSEPAAAHDIPSEVILHGFVKPENDQLHFLVRLPLILLQNIAFPTRGPGYIDLARIDTKMKKTSVAITAEIEFFEDGRRLTSGRTKTRISQQSDRSFETYTEAFANIEGPGLPVGTNVFWNQGFLDAHLEYPIRSESSDFSVRMRFTGFRKILKLRLRFIPPDGQTRTYELFAGSGRMALDPRWHQAAWVFVKSGFFHILDGIDHLLFLLCLVIPFRRQWWNLVKVVTSFTVAHSITLIASAQGLVPAGDWFPPLVEMLIAVSILYMALENVVGANLRRRWLIAGAFGLVHGFGFSFALKQDLQFAGSHLLLSLLSFNVGVEIGQILVLLVVLPALGLLFRHPVVTRFGVVILSVLVGHTAWHWMLERVETLRRVSWPTLDADFVVMVARGVLVLLLVGAGAWLIVRKLGHRFASQKPRTKDDLTIEDGLT